MRFGKNTRNILYLLVISLLGSLAIVNIMNESADIKGDYIALRNRITDSVTRALIYEKPVSTNRLEQNSGNWTVIYVLGGDQTSLMPRFRKASSLYHRGISRKILVLSKTGITEFSPDLGRNLTNDEWAIRVLRRLKVRKEDIEPVSIQLGFFGTFSEAKNLPGIAEGKGFRRLVLITSSFHTRRVYASFSNFSADHHLELFIYGSDESGGWKVLLAEYIKLSLYKMIILPSYETIKKGREKIAKYFLPHDSSLGLSSTLST